MCAIFQEYINITMSYTFKYTAICRIKYCNYIIEYKFGNIDNVIRLHKVILVLLIFELFLNTMMHYFILSTFVLHTYGLVSSVCGHWATKQTNTFTKGMIVKLLLLLFFT